MPLVVVPKNLEKLRKGRPSLPEGTRRQHVQMRGGQPTKVWVKKVGKKWVYDGMVDAKRKTSNVGKRSTVRAEARKPKMLMDDVDIAAALTMSEADFKKNPPSGFVYQSGLAHEADRHSNKGKITVGPKFFQLPDVDAKKHVIVHEMAHTLEDSLSSEGAIDVINKFQAGVFDGVFNGKTVRGINGQYLPLENLTEAYAVLLDDPAFLEKHYPKAAKYVREMAEAGNFPIKIDDVVQPKKDEPLTPMPVGDFNLLKKQFTRRDRISEGQEVVYTGRYHKHRTGQKARLVAIGPSGFAMVQFSDGKVKSAGWRDVRPSGKIQPHSLYDGVDASNVYTVSGKVKEKLDETMKQKIGNSRMNYYDLAKEFQRRGFNLQVIGGTMRDILRGDDEVKDVDFIFNGTDRELFSIVKQINPSWVANAVKNKHLGLCSFTDGGDVVDITPVHKFSFEMQEMAKGWNLKDDATSRDLAMNTIQCDPLSGVVVDATGNGLKDIKDSVINFADPNTVKHAPVYILRAFKFIARGYKTTPETDATIRKHIRGVTSLSPKRRESFIRRQIGEKDGLAGLRKFKEVFKQYNANIWNREFDRSWRSVYRSMGGK